MLIELEDDLGLTTGPDAGRVLVVDHHGPLAGKDRPTALEQVFHLLGRPREEWSRWHDLVAHCHDAAVFVEHPRDSRTPAWGSTPHKP